jgi:single-strand DNA-binding protein
MSNPTITVIGRIGANPEAIGSGLKFRVATNDRVKNEATGEWEDRDTSWWTIKAWKNLAEKSKNLTKGQEVIVSGKIREENWTDQSGAKRTSYEITADNIAVTTHSLTKEPKVQQLVNSGSTTSWDNP